MSLYDGLDIGKEDGGSTKPVAGWSSSYKLLQSQLQAKKASSSQGRKSRHGGSTLAPVVDLKKSNDSELYFNQITGRIERSPIVSANIGSSPFIPSEPVPSLTGVADEYDPLRPNDYEEEEDDYEKPRKPVGGAAIAPPTSLIEDIVPDQSGSPIMPNRSNSPPMGYSIGLGGSVASKIMAKYGYKEGQGLGKLEQGMSTALFVEKTSKRGGKIIHEKDLPKLEPPKESSLSNTNLMKNPSKVVLLRNMVGPGEVDKDLEPETAEECTKYGKVIKCVIFEIPNGDDEEAVRIFVEFERVDSAIKAIIDLNGRYFGGRIVKACFYNLDKFRRLDLGGEIDSS